MRDRARIRRPLAPYLADSLTVEAAQVVAFFVGIIGGYGLQLLGTPSGSKGAFSSGERLGLSLIIGLLAAVLVDLAVDRMERRARRGALEKLEVALTDRNMFHYFVQVSAYYQAAVRQLGSSRHGELYRYVSGELLKAEGWKELAEGRLEIRDPTREQRVARELLPTAETRVRAIAVPEDLDYLGSIPGAEYLEAQSVRVKETVEILRLFVYSDRDAASQGTDAAELRRKIDHVAATHRAKNITCRILKYDTGRVNRREVPDINVYDEHTVRYSTLQLGAGRMQSVVSGNPEDVEKYKSEFDYLWDEAERPPPADASADSPSARAGSLVVEVARVEGDE